ncbi:hypothetical protein LTR70_006142 [Exophiala xenobiotica]|uniref:Uncharacterized protein n=1 Tax=Lithohypha guttulata TaxID=1690604 RepID=A0ABR0K9X9_9EURO|nr:hypothetical protein LTR24_005621 [Lithohypha guttulata]KAK5316895.1 hypothetical protein LTR70_006142 [Exophiala xenobiotica]
MAETGYSNTGNAQRKFKEALKKDGYQYAGGQVTPLSSTEVAKATPTSSKRKKNKEPVAAAAKGDETPSKRQKTKSDKDDNSDDGEQI